MDLDQIRGLAQQRLAIWPFTEVTECPDVVEPKVVLITARLQRVEGSEWIVLHLLSQLGMPFKDDRWQVSFQEGC